MADLEAQAVIFDKPGKIISSVVLGAFILVAIAASACGDVAESGIDRATSLEYKLTASDGASDELFGFSVAISGSGIALVGALSANERVGSAYVYERQGDGSWLELDELNASDGAKGDVFGRSVSLSGERALVGAHGDDQFSGSAYIFERQYDGSWQEVAKLTASDRSVEDAFGRSVSLSGERALVGADVVTRLKGDDRGSAYIYERQRDGSWQEVAKLTASDGTRENDFGFSVSLSGTRAIVGAAREDTPVVDSGSVYVYEMQEDDSWREVARLIASDGASGDLFGLSVSLSGDRALIGAISDGHDVGSAYIYERQSDGSWREVAKLRASDGIPRDLFGRVSLSESRALVGTNRERTSASAYVFERQADGSWPEVATLAASDGFVGNSFGRSVSLSESGAIVGASRDNHWGTDSGSAYVFENFLSR